MTTGTLEYAEPFAGPQTSSPTFRLAAGIGMLAFTLVASSAGSTAVQANGFPYFSVGTGWNSQDVASFSPRIVRLKAGVSETAVQPAVQNEALSANLVRRIYEQSGLTWDQVAKLFGVSRRSVHFWASGGRLSAANQESLARVAGVIDGLPASTPVERRALFLAPTAEGPSLFDGIRAEHASRASDINRSVEPSTVRASEA